MAYIGVSPSNGVRRVHTYTATASQTTFSGAGAEGTSLSYKDSNFVDVYQNGVKLGDADYTATSGTSIVLGTGATASDLVVIVVFDVFSVADTVSKADGGTFDGAVTFAGTATFSGSVVGISSAADDITAGDAAVNLTTTSGNITIDAQGNDTDIIFKGTDNSSDITMLTLDGSEAGAATFNGAVTANAGVSVDNITIDGTEIDLSSGDLSIDVAGNVQIDADDSGEVRLLDGGTQYAAIKKDGNNAVFQSIISDGDFVIQGIDSSVGSFINAIYIDMSNEGAVGINNTAPAGKLQVNTANMGNLDAVVLKNETNNVNGYFVRFRRSSDAEIGSIEQTGGGATVSYNTSSDYRLKENVDYTFDATTRLKQLKPARFNFIGDTATVDGFLAHEVSDIVPHAISGKKDATENYTDENGDEQTVIKPQGIDHGKLVPLLTKSLQEALTRIDTLEAEVKALKG